ncbi:pilus assembly protein TadG-related protein [Burkholderia sp. Ac-20353]|uniref:pilus assembly protein TadG-related protein n=1 Tax=Burkholderia sp. Ac-20353 TaxID=2703894 RepID=UPI00197C465F|nr:pilus assembly protein TadG-related protein [Burkholderia sp. Ac-20353]MBN3792291.1 pilus assembly protein TadG [Burkholderia sp. Ac-20353]
MSSVFKPSQAFRNIHRQRGVVAVIVAFTLAVLIGCVGLALDLGKLYVARSELQNSADACALAAARDLTGAIANLSVSEAAGITAGHLNYAMFQGAPVQYQTNSSVTYSDSLTNPFLPASSVTSPSTIKYVKCTASLTNIPNWFMQVLNVLPGMNVANASVAATAVATTGSAQTTCAIPVFLCQKSGGHTPGEWLSALGTTTTWGSGNFGWAALDGSNSNSEITNELTGNYCSLPATGSQIGSPGQKAASADAWNTRFGVYGHGFKQPTAGTPDNTPDFTGVTYNAATGDAPTSNIYGSTDAYTKFVNARLKNNVYQGDQATGISTGGTALTQSGYQTYGADRRIALAPEVDCSALVANGTHKTAVLRWDCVLMLEPMDSSAGSGGAGSIVAQVEYLGTSTAAGNPCASEGVPGDGSSVGPQVSMLVQ